MKLYILNNTHERSLIVSKNIDIPIVSDIKENLMLKKCEIDTLNPKKWELSKKQLNPYEFIYTSSKKCKNICSIIPISRSYFKLHEMIKDLNLLENNIYCACIAEGPGGFINCLNNINYDIKKIYGITLISKDHSIPYWNQSILNNSNNHISLGKDGTGDIYKYENINYFINEINNNLCHLVTADGGFDYSRDYNSQEINSYKLLYSEIYIALNIQKENGHFILKVFDVFNYKTIQLIYILYLNYSSITFFKPSTSRLSNSEKYIICKGFLGKNKDIINMLRSYYKEPLNLFIDIPQSFINNIKDYNVLYTNKQYDCINTIIEYIKNGKLDDKPSKEQISLAKKWCELYQLPINKNCIYNE